MKKWQSLRVEIQSADITPTLGQRVHFITPHSLIHPKLNAHSSTPTPVFLPSREETQTMVREKLGPKLRPPQTLYLLGKGETQTMV